VQKDIRGRGGPHEPVSLFISTPVWGAGHLGLFTRIGLPSLLASGNLPGLSCRATSRYFIYTQSENAAQLRAARAFRALAEIIPVEIIPIRDEIGDPHRMMSDCHIDTMRRADAAGAAAVFLPPDCVWSDGSMVRLEAIANSGKSVIHMSGIRLDRDAVVPHLLEHASSGGRVLSIGARPLVDIGLRHLHPIALSHFWNEHGGGLMPANLIWTVPEEGLLLRCFHLHPLLVKSQVRFAGFASTIDDDLPLHACPDDSRDHVVTDSDELLAFELSGRDRIVGTVCPKGSIDGVARWAEVGANKRHRALIRHAIRLHSGPVTETAWAAREAESSEVVEAVACLNALPMRELFMRNRIALKGRIDSLTIGRGPLNTRRYAWLSVAMHVRKMLMKMNAAVYNWLFLRNGALRMTHPSWLVQRSTLASILSCLASKDRTMVLIGAEPGWATEVEEARPGLTVRAYEPAALANALRADGSASSALDAVVVLDLDAETEASQRMLTALSRSGTRCFWLASGNAARSRDNPCSIRQVGGPGTLLVNRARLRTQRHTRWLSTRTDNSIWLVRQAVELVTLLLRPVVYVGGAFAGLLLNLLGVVLDQVHATMCAEGQPRGVHRVAARVPTQE
jgi:hypothetical protein